MPAAVVGGVISGVGSLLGGIFGGNAAKKAGEVLENAGNTASQKIGDAATAASSTLKPYIGQAQQDVGTAVAGAQKLGSDFIGTLSPYQAAGGTGIADLNKVADLSSTAFSTPFSFNPSDLKNDPGYQFQLEQGLRANQNQMTAAGLGNSGAAAKGANSFATGLAGTYFNNAYQRQLNTYQTNRENSQMQLNALMGAGSTLAGIGQNANAQALNATEFMGNIGLQGGEYQGNVGLQGATQMGNWNLSGTEAAQQAYMQGQQGKAAGIMGKGNAWQNAIGGMANAIGGGFALSSMNNGGYGGGGGGGDVMWQPGQTSYDTETGASTFSANGPEDLFNAYI